MEKYLLSDIRNIGQPATLDHEMTQPPQTLSFSTESTSSGQVTNSTSNTPSANERSTATTTNSALDDTPFKTPAKPTSAPLLPHNITLHDVCGYQKIFGKEYKSNDIDDDRYRLGSKLQVSFFSEGTLSKRNITGNVSAGIHPLETTKIEFLRSVVFHKFLAPDLEKEDADEHHLTVKLDTYLRVVRHEREV